MTAKAETPGCLKLSGFKKTWSSGGKSVNSFAHGEFSNECDYEDENYSVMDNQYYNEDVDIDQQSDDFWNQL